MKFLLKVLGIFGLVLVSRMPASYAQFVPHFQLGVGATGVLYTGDLSSTEEWYHRVYPGMNVSLQLDNPRRISTQLNLGFGRNVMQDREYPFVEERLPNTFASTTYFYSTFLLKMRFLRRHRVRPHIAAGAGLLLFQPKGVNGQSLTNNPALRAPSEEYTTASGLAPLNVGADFRINEFFSVGFDLTYNVLFTDYFDNIGQLGVRAGNDNLTAVQISLLFRPALSAKKGRGQR
jgi:hypothetical protein